jgi:hypothetical protein
MNHLVIGLGEVGGGLLAYLQNQSCSAEGLDVSPAALRRDTYDVLHVCIPYKDNIFIQTVKKYAETFKPTYVIIHSTVPLGVTAQCFLGAIHSPVRGKHPNIDRSLGVFVKYFGGPVDGILRAWIAKTFPKFFITEKSETTEALKLWDTTQYGWMIVLQKEMLRWCKEHGVPFEVVYAHANETYNEGYKEFKMEHVIRPVLKATEGKIGGHCVVQNAQLLDSFVAEEIIKFNEQLE